MDNKLRRSACSSLLFFKCCITVILFITFSTCSPLFAKNQVKVAFGNSLLPWVMPDQDRGILVDLARASFDKSPYQMLPVYYPYARRIKAYKSGHVDVVTDITPQVVVEEKLIGYLSDRFYYYENVVISLSEKSFKINSLKDISSLRILAWQGAIETLGTEYALMALSNPFYKETFNQQSQVEMLFKKRTDVIQLDTQIFHYLRHKLAQEGKIDTYARVDYAPILGRNYCAFLFRDEVTRDAFNKEVRALIKQEEKIQRIYKHYTNHLTDITFR
ncbi:hypothetical protein CW745_06045 [Psychromonas sp. psych-6C06]|uniref:substrate-binding periplasmic protein n=1 Tax=Psychromonas sp. psych-6C06 TaxID=2058089 RepID=UPI000C341AB5|nr:transporter substrate-binding domain-containing protein [Psychromonas sp. psych-6C06]PKF62985.1 hypothetical protein CW745_06045 [Psychromonas sp. psych-6C06]